MAASDESDDNTVFGPADGDHEAVAEPVAEPTVLASGTRIDRIPTSRWLLAPRSSFLLSRRMILWQITSYPQALVLEHQRLQAIARLQEDYGRFLWRWKAPLSERLALHLATAGMSFNLESLDDDVAEDQDRSTALPEKQPSVATLFSHLPRRCMIEPPKAPEIPSNPDRVLIAAAAEILRDAERQGDRISQAALAKKLRERGHRVTNDRLRWLINTVQRTPMQSGAS